MKIIKFTFFLFAAWACSFLSAQDQDSAVINNLFQEALSSDIAYENLRYLCEHIGPRLCGSSQAAAAVEYTKQILEKMGLDTVFLQNVEVPNWVDNGTESAVISSINGTIKVNTCALGLSVGTADGGIDAEAVEVKTFEELKNLGEDKIAGKIVFYNQPMDPKQINPLRAYSEVSKSLMACTA